MPQNIEREIMFKLNQKSLRITETPKAAPPQFKQDDFSEYASASAEKERKVWKNDTSKPENIRETLPNWARSTVGIQDTDDAHEDNIDDNIEDFLIKKEAKEFTKLKETVSADEDSDDSQDEISEEQKNSTRSINEGEDHDDANDSEEMADAFNFDQSKIRKTSVP